jgi:TolA-binding protein
LADARLSLSQLRDSLPDLERQARDAVEYLGQGRDRLRDYLSELHAFARQGRDDLEALSKQVRAEGEEVRRQEQALHRVRDEHRLAVAAFRQQIIEWQGQLAEMRRTLAQGETHLERRQAEVDARAREVEATTLRLARQSEELDEQQRQVAERRHEMERHLADMREWYRRKLRELAGNAEPVAPTIEDTPPPAPADGNVAPAGASRDILSLTGEVDPGDRQLGELLRGLELVDADTLTALLVEARRQRRSLRQVLLSSNYLTLYQLALIEAGNVDALVLGPTRVVDRLRSTPRETVYRVFDPRVGHEALLRHLSEADARDAVRPDEFRQRFAAAASIRHPHLAATLEVLELAGRPAVLQEWLTGLASADWPALAAVPGVWFRLLNQAALGLHTAHQAGLVHGHLSAGRIVLTGDGILKACGLGEPPWLLEPEPGEEAYGDDAASDLTALGRIAAGWARVRGKGKGKPLPEALQAVLQRLVTEDPAERFPDAAALLEALDRAGTDVPANAEAWDRLLRHVRDHAAPEVAQRQSA